ncbi:hypothetical protein KJ980_06065 [Patescibacteria group bacterium]|nr:hypothetical protein [Patescibacteria group bacterium]MBU4017382.1 hypothetical protein [Patescibacteria group bacterium]MBU4099185.1 hypothetical protein [Patescibacteria group bacterium]
MNKNLLYIIKSQFRLDLNGDHGIGHWKRVEKIAIYLSTDQDVDIEVIRLFAYMHDSRREDEYDDPLHGFHAAKYVLDLYEKNLLGISRQQLETLMYACEHHSNQTAKSDNITIQICWDSDRLDIWRLGIEPDPKYFYTGLAKQPETILYAKRLYSNCK